MGAKGSPFLYRLFANPKAAGDQLPLRAEDENTGCTGREEESTGGTGGLQDGEVAGDLVVGYRGAVLLPLDLLVLYEAIEDVVTQGFPK